MPTVGPEEAADHWAVAAPLLLLLLLLLAMLVMSSPSRLACCNIDQQDVSDPGKGIESPAAGSAPVRHASPRANPQHGSPPSPFRPSNAVRPLPSPYGIFPSQIRTPRRDSKDHLGRQQKKGDLRLQDPTKMPNDMKAYLPDPSRSFSAPPSRATGQGGVELFSATCVTLVVVILDRWGSVPRTTALVRRLCLAPCSRNRISRTSETRLASRSLTWSLVYFAVRHACFSFVRSRPQRLVAISDTHDGHAGAL